MIRALFDEGNKLRHFTVELMRALDRAGIDCFLPDLPGTNESLEDHRYQSLEGWRDAMNAAARYFRATHVLAIRGGALIAPAHLPNIHYAPASGASLLRAMLRAQLIIASEAGHKDTREDLIARGSSEGLRLAGYEFGPQMINSLGSAVLTHDDVSEIAQGDVGGSALWLRAEPSHDAAQASSLAHLVARQTG
ncbi:MAG: hypothetical protein WA957_07160 [Alteraurantiacibacter sp.]